MGSISITLAPTVTLDGVVHSNSQTVVIPCVAYSQQTRDFTDVFEVVADSSGVTGYVIVINKGNESLFVQFRDGDPSYIVFEVVSGGHGIFPTSLFDGDVFSTDQMSARSATSTGTRAVIITVQTG